MTKERLHALWQIVWEWRARVQESFPTPGRDDCLAFALTEAAEAVDAELRLNLAYRRSGGKVHSVERELTQCAMMLLSAVPPSFSDWNSGEYFMGGPWTVRNLAIRVSQCLERPANYFFILRTVAAIDTFVNLLVTLPEALERLEQQLTTRRKTTNAVYNILSLGVKRQDEEIAQLAHSNDNLCRIGEYVFKNAIERRLT